MTIRPSTPSAWQLPGLVAGLGVFLVLAFGISYQKGIGGQYSWATTEVRPTIDRVDGRDASPRARAVNNMAKVVGDELMTRYVIAFEVAGLLLTVALVGAIAIAHREEVEPSRRERPDGRREPAARAGDVARRRTAVAHRVDDRGDASPLAAARDPTRCLSRSTSESTERKS